MDSTASDSLPFDFIFKFPNHESSSTELKAHRHVLSTKSEFFKGLFDSGMEDCALDHFVIEDFSPESFSMFLRFLYTSKLSLQLKPKRFVELFAIGNFFGVPDLCNWLLDHVDRKSICSAAAEITCAISWPRISEKFQNYVVDQLAKLTDRDLREIPENTAAALIQTALAAACWPLECFRFVKRWANANGVKAGSGSLPECILGLIPFEKMSRTEFEEFVAPSGLLSEERITSARAKIPESRDWSLFRTTGNLLPSFCVDCPSPSPLTVSAPSFPRPTLFVGNEKRDAITGELLGETKDLSTEIFTRSNACNSENKLFTLLSNEVHVFDGEHDGSFLKSFGKGHLLRPSAISMDHVKKQLHVADPLKHCILVFSESGDFAFSYGSEGSGPGQLKRPCDVAVDGQRGLVAIADHDSPQISVFRTSGKFVKSFGRPLTNDWKIWKARFGGYSMKRLAVDLNGGCILVLGEERNCLQVLSWDGKWIGGFPGFLSGMQHIAVGPQGRLYVVHYKGHEKKLLCL